MSRNNNGELKRRLKEMSMKNQEVADVLDKATSINTKVDENVTTSEEDQFHPYTLEERSKQRDEESKVENPITHKVDVGESSEGLVPEATVTEVRKSNIFSKLVTIGIEFAAPNGNLTTVTDQSEYVGVTYITFFDREDIKSVTFPMNQELITVTRNKETGIYEITYRCKNFENIREIKYVNIEGHEIDMMDFGSPYILR